MWYHDKISPDLHHALSQFEGAFDIEVWLDNDRHYDSFTRNEIFDLVKWPEISRIVFDPRIKDRRWRER